jgi:hypothetical protein
MRFSRRLLAAAGLLLVLIVPVPARAGGGLSDALDQQEQARARQQLERRDRTERQGDELQRQLDQARVQQWLDQQLNRERLIRPCASLIVRCPPSL